MSFITELKLRMIGTRKKLVFRKYQAKDEKTFDRNSIDYDIFLQMMKAINVCNFELAKLLLTSDIVNTQDASGATPLIAACRSCARDKENEGIVFVDFLINKGAFLDVYDNSKKTAYDFAENNGLHNIKTHIALASNYQAIQQCF